MNNPFQNDFIPPMTTITSGSGAQVRKDVFYLPVKIVNVCMVGDADNPNSDWVLIDAGMSHSADLILRESENRFGKNRPPSAIVLTHGHFDHVGAISELISYWNIPVYAHERELPYLTGQSNYPPADTSVDGGLVTELSPLFPHHGINLGDNVHPLPDNGTVPGMPGWRWLHTPGHTPGHISLFRDEDSVLIAGDAFVTVKQESLYKVVLQVEEISGPPAYFTMDWDAAWDSIRRLAALNPSVAVTGHGRPVSGDDLARGLETLVNAVKQ